MAAGSTSHMCIRMPLIHVNQGMEARPVGMEGGPAGLSQKR
jgi:hypothetical protein